MSHRVEAVIVAGGFGTRLRPLTDRRPKHLLEVGGVPFLEHQIARLADAGVQHVVLATSYHAEKFEPVLGDGSRWGLSLGYVQEEEPLGTAGAIRNVAGALTGGPDDPVVVLNGDILSGHDIRRQLDDFARPRDGRPVDVSLHLVEVPDARAFGSVPTDAEGRVTAFLEKSEDPVSRQVNAGCYVFRRAVVDEIPAGREVSVEHETFPGLVEQGRVVVGHVDGSYWRDVGTPEALVAASRDLVDGTAVSPATPLAPGAAWVDGSALVEPGAEVADGSSLVRGSSVAAGASVHGSVLMAGAAVQAGATVVDSVLGPGAVVGADATVHGVTVGDLGRVRDGAELRDVRVGCEEAAG